MPLWIAAALLAASAQALRFALQKSLSLGGISATGATFARFVYSAPIVGAALAVWLWSSGTALPDLSARFWGFAVAGGLAQILATICVVLVFQSRNFAVGVTFAKTEVIMTALLGLLLLGDSLTWGALGAIGLGVVGVVVLSVKPDEPMRLASIGNRAAALGLTAGALFAVSAVSYRGASLSIDAEPLLRAGVTLSAVTAMQMVGLGAWMALRDAGEIGRVLKAWPRGLPLGVASLIGSYGWFLAFTLQNAAYVKAVGQVELIFVLILGALAFGERVTRRELWGMALLSASIVGLLIVV